MASKDYVSLVDLKEDLRTHHRIKDGVDYSIIEKYDERVLTCHVSYFDTIIAVAKHYRVTLKRALMYDDRGW